MNFILERPLKAVTILRLASVLCDTETGAGHYGYMILSGATLYLEDPLMYAVQQEVFGSSAMEFQHGQTVGSLA